MSNETKLLQEIQEKRDLLRLRAHLGTMEMRSQWDSLEAKWKRLLDRMETSNELEDAGRKLVDELKKGYEKLETTIAAARHECPEPCLEQKEVEDLAYELWDRRGRQVGSPEDDWLRAGKILSGQQAQEQPALVGAGVEYDGFPEPNWN
jgi:uncharacterized coiled-coil DUF342 family protein